MRIALFHNLPSGGAKRALYEQVRRLAPNHVVDGFSIATADRAFCDLSPYLGANVVAPFAPLPLLGRPLGRLNQAIRIADLFRLRRVQRRLARSIDEGGYDAALVHQCMFTFTPTLLRHLATPSLYYRHDPVRWVHDPVPARPYERRNPLRARLDACDPLRAGYFRLLVHEDRTSMLAAGRVLTNSCFMRESLYRIYGCAPDVCYLGVDADAFRPLDRPRERVVLSVGALSPRKGFDFLVDSVARVTPELRPRLVIVGNEATPGEVAFLVERAETRRVVLDVRRLVSDDALVDLYNRACCTVYAPMMEPFGLVPLESMACGTPVVGIREGGVRETVVDEITGLLAHRDPGDFGARIEQLVSDAVLARTLGAAAREHVLRHWTWDRSIQRLERTLTEVVTHRPTGDDARGGSGVPR